jgi:hypothetical protein
MTTRVLEPLIEEHLTSKHAPHLDSEAYSINSSKIASSAITTTYRICEEPVNKVNKIDEGTPDNWVMRHPDMVRLTGKHPFNAEV